jgi:hypothetical protein
MPAYPAGASLSFIVADPEEDLLVLVAVLNSFVVDFVFRQKATGANASFFLIRQLPFLSRVSVEVRCPWDQPTTVRSWLAHRVVELSCTSDDMRVPDLGGTPFIFDDSRRTLLRAELDAAMFHLYGVDRDSAVYVLDSFRVFRRADIAANGEYRSKRLILEIYDEIADAERTGRPYLTRLDPPPADPRVAHSDTRVQIT